MGLTTGIEWCDSTTNPSMGCDGCELWNQKAGVRSCYAGTLTNRYAGRTGWPKSFGEPVLFPERIKQAIRWADLTGKERPNKPWLNGYPRIIFLDDLGDAFTKSLPLDWLAPHIPVMRDSPHIWILLTKQPARMRLFWEEFGPVPRNFWLLTSVASAANLHRIAELLKIPRAAVYGVSLEPLLGPISFRWASWDDGSPHHRRVRQLPDVLRDGKLLAGSINEYDGLRMLDWVIAGGESGPGARPAHPDWFRSVRDQCAAAGTAFFFKQWGQYQPISRADGIHELPFGDYAPETGFGFVRKDKASAGRLLDGREHNGMPVIL